MSSPTNTSKASASLSPPSPLTSKLSAWFGAGTSRRSYASSTASTSSSASTIVAESPPDSRVIKKSYEDLEQEALINKEQYHVAAKELLLLNEKAQELAKVLEESTSLANGRQKEIDALYEQVAEQNAEIQNYRAEQRGMKQRVAELTKRIAELEQQGAEYADQLQTQKIEYEPIEARAGELTENLEYATDETAHKIRAQEDEILRAKNAFKDMDAHIQDQDFQIAALEGDLADSKKKIADLKHMAKSAEELRTALDEANGKIDALTEKLRMADEHNASHLHSQKQDRRQHKAQLKAKEAELARLQKAQQDKDMEFADMVAKLKEMEARMAAAKSEKQTVTEPEKQPATEPEKQPATELEMEVKADDEYCADNAPKLKEMEAGVTAAASAEQAVKDHWEGLCYMWEAAC